MRIDSRKIILFIVVLVLSIIFTLLTFEISRHLIFRNSKDITLSESDYIYITGIPCILGIFIGIAFVATQKTWNMIDFIYSINKKVDAVQIQSFLDARCGELGFNPIWMHSDEVKKK